MQDANLWFQQSNEGKKDATLIIYNTTFLFQEISNVTTSYIKKKTITRISHFLLDNSSEVYINFFVRTS